jgi:hypothetical protein
MNNYQLIGDRFFLMIAITWRHEAIALIGICPEKIFSFKQKQGALNLINEL